MQLFTFKVHQVGQIERPAGLMFDSPVLDAKATKLRSELNIIQHFRWCLSVMMVLLTFEVFKEASSMKRTH